MPYLVQYQYSYKQKIASSSQQVQVTLFQKSSLGSGTPVITQLVASKPAFRVNVIDNDKDKFKSVRGKQATLMFKPQTGITASTFSSGADDEWIVEAVVVSTGFFLFKGFLIMDDHQQSFLPVSHQYDIELTATDNLGTLKEVPLTDDSGLYIRGYKKIIEVIAQCLRKTGLQLDIIVRDSWMEESQTTFGPACNVTYLQMKTFEKDINEAVDCYTALEIIFGYRLSIKQYNGTWWVENIDEKTTNQAYLFRFDYTGTYVGQEPLAYYIEAIGKAEEIKLLNKDAVLSYTRPVKYSKLTYRYEFPREIIDNIDYSRGTFVSFDTGTLTATYSIADWTLKAGTIGTPATVTRSAYIKKTYSDINQTYEKSRHIVITTGTTSHWLESNPLPISQNDKFTVSVDFALPSNISGSTISYYGIGVLLIADDGTKWIYGSRPVVGDYKWTLYTGASVDDSRLIYAALNNNDTDETQWNNIGGDVPPAPVSGDLFIRLIAYNGNEIKYSNLQFNYDPYINGDYSKYGGHSFKIEQSGNYKANIDEVVQLGDSPKKLFKGAMFKLVAGKYVLTGNWFAGGDLLRQGIVPPYPPDDIYLHPFGWLQIYAVWNQYNRRMIELSGSATGLKLDNVPPDLIDTYQVIATTDAGTQVTTDKEFMLVGMEQDYQEGNWNLSLSETNDSTIGKDFTTPLTFKYDT
jgi:hypothetical protein